MQPSDLKRPYHALPLQEAAEALGSHPQQGLDPDEAARRLESFGSNEFPRAESRGPLLSFLLQFHQPLVYILLAAGGVSLLLGEWIDSGVIFGVVLINAAIGFLQEDKAARAIQALARTMVSESRVVRGGRRMTVSSRELVPGDLVELASGDKVGADLRLVAAKELRCDESALTGESLPAHKSVHAVDESAQAAERACMAFGSTLVVHGTGHGLVTATGAQAEVGRISHLMAQAGQRRTPLLLKIDRVSRALMLAILILAAATVVVGVAWGNDLGHSFMAAVALAVGAIPEGLPAALSVILAIGVARMARRRAIVRKLPTVETLGSCTVICTDKTGTLTENQMTVTELRLAWEWYGVTGTGYAPRGEIQDRDGKAVDPASSVALQELLRAGILCNDARIESVEGGNGYAAKGDPTEAALLALAAKTGMDAHVEREARPRLDLIAFESERQYMATLNDGEVRRAHLKGAVEQVLDRCTLALDPAGGEAVLDADAVRAWAKELAAQGLRVLALARKDLDPGVQDLEHHHLASGCVFLGLAAMLDPPKPSAMAAVKACRSAGIRVKMITGDHADTALAIARAVGISDASGSDCDGGEDSCLVLTGKELMLLGDRRLAKAAQQAEVFARVTPEQKYRLVKALQSKGEIVAMTGDGVNDAPALRQADIGVAMGRSGTEVAKEAADMVLTDDDFATIEAAVEEGRSVYENLLKFLVWALPTNIGAGLVILVAAALGSTLPILPVQILWINMTTAGILGIMLAFEPREPGIMDRPPRPPDSPVLTAALVRRMALVGGMLVAASFGLFRWELAHGGSLAQARTVAVNAFVMIELAYLFNCRSMRRSILSTGVAGNPWVLAGAGLMVGLQLLYSYAPFMNVLFHGAPLGGGSWLGIGAVAAACFLVVELEKALARLGGSGATPLHARGANPQA